MRLGLQAATLASFVVLAGCSGSGGPQTASIEEVESTIVQTAAAATQTRAPSVKNVSEEGGTILGTVTDDEYRPIEGVLVTLLQFEAQASTDLGGRYAFTDVPGGSYALTYEHPQFKTAGRNADVEVGGERRLDVILESLPFGGSYHETQVSKSLIVVGEAFVDILVCQELGGKCVFFYETKTDLYSIVIEADFIPTIPANPTDGNTLYYQLRETDAGGVLYGDGYWKPKQKRILEGDWAKDKTHKLWHQVSCHIYWVCFQQTSTHYVTFFYIEKAPPTFSALPP